MRLLGLSRRKFLKNSAIAGGVATLGGVVGVGYTEAPVALSQASPPQASDDKMRMSSPASGEVLKAFLAAQLRWEYAAQAKAVVDGTPVTYLNYRSVNLKVSPNEDLSNPLDDVHLPDHITRWCLAVIPNHKYYWQIIPRSENGDHPELGFKGTFTAGSPHIDETSDSSVRYKNPRIGAHFAGMKPIRFAQYEPLSPWYDVKSYNSPPPPEFEDIKDKLPVPVFDGHPEALETYWYCWKTLIDKWYCGPDALDHQAVANLNCTRSWDIWGSSQVFDSAYMMYFAKYGHQAYPFINQYDNAYARQHENGFICRESDSNNREVYAGHPALAPFLMGWAEWNYYLVSGDVQRLKQVLLPIVKNYEWWMVYMRRKDGLYSKQGLTKEERLNFKGDDTLDYAVGNNATRAAEALYVAKIATVVGRPDLAEFFNAEHSNIGRNVNSRLWDAKHEIYNDRYDPEHPVLKYSDPKQAGVFITEIEPGVINKRVETLLPLFGEIVPKERVQQVVQELMNPNSFNRPNGIPSLSADSAGYDREGRAWPPYQCMVQEGLRANGQYELARKLAEKYFNAVAATYTGERTIKESIRADKLEFSGASDFVGWGGVGPIANFIEYILGFEVSVPAQTITWRISRTERHGIKNLKFGEFYVELISEVRQNAREPYHVSITSGGRFNLRIVVNGRITERKIEKGTLVIHETRQDT